MIFQDYALFPWMSVAQNIAFGLEMKNIPRSEREHVTRHHVETGERIRAGYGSHWAPG